MELIADGRALQRTLKDEAARRRKEREAREAEPPGEPTAYRGVYAKQARPLVLELVLVLVLALYSLVNPHSRATTPYPHSVQTQSVHRARTDVQVHTHA